MTRRGTPLPQAVAGRIVGRHLTRSGATGVLVVDSEFDPLKKAGVDVVCTRAGRGLRIKVQPDPYFGLDPERCADHSLVFYRKPADAYAFETIAHHVTREPAWVFASTADDAYYYFLALSQPEDEVAALMEERDEVFFSELAVDRDELHILPMTALRTWFAPNSERYLSRPVGHGDHSRWCRIVPIADVSGAVPGVTVAGRIFEGLSVG
jgi:hypothetical protein